VSLFWGTPKIGYVILGSGTKVVSEPIAC